MHVVIVGAGASGCFCAINFKRRMPDARVTVIEKSTKALAKLAITGGGRCNLTNTFRDVRDLSHVYPRGDKLMRRMLSNFSNTDTMQWFDTEGVKLITQSDQCVFPQSQDAMEIVSLLLRLMHHHGIELLTSTKVENIVHNSDSTFTVSMSSRPDITADRVVVTVGGKASMQGYGFLSALDIGIIQPSASLFTFHVDDEALHSLMGTVVDDVAVKVIGRNYSASGPLLITHWGLSGPSILRLSSYAARHLYEHSYRTKISINWLPEFNEESMNAHLEALRTANPQRQIGNIVPASASSPRLTQKLWLYILNKVEVNPQRRWQEIGKKQLRRLSSALVNDEHTVTGKGRNKEEFVTCGGVALSEINISTMESKRHKGLFFAGEILDVDGVTGGFNLQAAWSMAFTASQHL